MRWLLPRAALTVALLLAGAARAEVPAQRQGELRHLLRHDCGSCHGLTMRGGLGRPLLPETLADRSDEALAAVILHGLRGTPMPPWGGELTAEEARWMVQVLRQGVGDGR
ncbi:c-type cytochrome [Roseicella aquatilis]|uniref:Cytochrome c n=1 Tax=Roseicella aquatilis TaxID=2527868 RepID=A0A4R4D846_9PROT|nr:cytochrome c [Roseicella aquatilis]TCZ56005.1 cytochrome c [Roseicella aquatilis]